MNRWSWADPTLLEGEATLGVERNVRLYDGDNKTQFEGGELLVTSHRLLWSRPGGGRSLALPLSRILTVEEEAAGAFSFGRPRKLVLHFLELAEPAADFSSAHSHAKLSAREGAPQLAALVARALREQRWLRPAPALRTGIAGIERGLAERQRAADRSISAAFRDLGQLMAMAKDMVRLSAAISGRIRDRQGEITEDETVRFKSYLLSLGIDDPVTRNDFKSDSRYYRSLAEQISEALVGHIREMGGMMALTDAFCRINRARGFELLSPEDVLNACLLMESLNLSLKVHEFQSGVKVLQLSELNDESVAQSTADLIIDKESLTAEELGQLLGISITLAKERLLITEKMGKSCRDDSIEGLRFYPNLFLSD